MKKNKETKTTKIPRNGGKVREVQRNRVKNG
jgi:hypothetical protein